MRPGLLLPLTTGRASFYRVLDVERVDDELVYDVVQVPESLRYVRCPQGTVLLRVAEVPSLANTVRHWLGMASTAFTGAVFVADPDGWRLLVESQACRDHEEWLREITPTVEGLFPL